MKWIFRGLSALVVLVVAAVAALFLLPADRIAKLVTDQFQSATGRAMTLQGDVRPTLWPELGINTGAVSIANASWSDRGPMLQADGLSIGVDIGALFGGDIRIKQVVAQGPKVLLEVAKDGRANWEFGTGGDSSGGVGGLPEFSLERAEISDAKLSFLDHSTGSRTELTAVDATLGLASVDGAASLRMSAAMNGQAFTLNADIAAFETFLIKGATGVTADLVAGASNMAFKGQAGLVPLAAGGRLDADLGNMAGLFRMLGQTAPEVPRGLGQDVAIKGDVTLTDAGRITLRGGTIRLDDNVLNGAVDITTSGRPRVVAQLTAGALDFAGLTGGGPDTGEAATEWSRTPIDASGMQAVDAEIALDAESLDIGIAKLGRTRLLTKLDAGRAVTDIRELVAYGGALAGSVVVNSRGGVSMRANLTGDGVALQPLLKELAGYDRLLADGDVTVNLLAVGNDLNALMSGLSGDGTVKLDKGELRGLDLAGMLRNLDASYIGEGAKTIFDAVNGSFTIEGGVLRNKDLKMTAPLVNATGTGTLGIGAQNIDYRIVGALLQGQENGGIRIPVMITGPWSKPRFRLDLEALAKQELADDVEKLKVQAEEVVKQKIKDELGVQVDDLKDVEDVLKKELENRVRDGLLDLLNKN